MLSKGFVLQVVIKRAKSTRVAKRLEIDISAFVFIGRCYLIGQLVTYSDKPNVLCQSRGRLAPVPIAHKCLLCAPHCTEGLIETRVGAQSDFAAQGEDADGVDKRKPKSARCSSVNFQTENASLVLEI
jgi:hypothetical protein